MTLQGTNLLGYRRRRHSHRRGNGRDAPTVPKLSQCTKLTKFHKFKLMHSNQYCCLV